MHGLRLICLSNCMLHTPVIYTYSLLQMIQAYSLFKEMEKKQFLLLHCWKELRNHPKWLAQLATQGNVSQKKQKKTADDSPTPSTPGTNSSRYVDDDVDDDAQSPSKEMRLKRPIGKKAAKQLLRQGKDSSTSSAGSSVICVLNELWSTKRENDAIKESKKEERYARALALEEERVRVEKQKLALQQGDSDERIMSMNLSGMDASLQQYYMGLKNDIISRRANNSD